MFNTFLPKILAFMEQCGEKCGRAGEATDCNMIWRMRIACWITKATNTYRICNTYWFPMATVVMRTRFIITFINTLPVLLFACKELPFLL